MTEEVLGLLRSRRMTVGELARRIGAGRTHVQLVLSNVPGRGHQTRRKLAPHLTAEELRALGWGPDGSLVNGGATKSRLFFGFRRSEKNSISGIVPCGTFSGEGLAA